MLGNHGWKGPQKTETRLVDSLWISALKELEATDGPSNERDAKALESDMGFGYREALGELIHSYVTSRLDMVYGVAQLSKFHLTQASATNKL